MGDAGRNPNAVGVLPDSKVAEIRDAIVRPAFRRDDYTTGIRSATETMAALIARGGNMDLARLAHPGHAGGRGAAGDYGSFR
jgi:uncharacterized membrane protein YgcG